MLRQLDPVTVVCGAVVVLGFLALGVLKWAEHPHWPGFAGSGGEDDGDRDSQPFVPQAGSMQDRPVSAATEFGPRPPPPQRRNRDFTPDGRDQRLMPTAERQEWLSTLDPNKANTTMLSRNSIVVDIGGR